MDEAPRFRIFFVCTGNQARSPIAAAWIARALAPLRVAVGSAGTMPRRSGPVLAEAAATARELGLDVSRHASSHVSAYDLSPADLVIGFEFHHVAAAVVDGGAPASKTFLLRELNRLVRGLPPAPGPDPFARARTSIELADRLRSRTDHVLGDDIRDPAGRRIGVFREIVWEVVRECEEMTRLLFGL
ncbi:MAG: low molecular weight phosphatase family protein [Actinomycetota bacterium]